MKGRSIAATIRGRKKSGARPGPPIVSPPQPLAARLDHAHVWHPFTQMRDWLRRPPTVIVSGRGAVLRDAAGREYLDANSSIWTNLHGHQHPKLNAAIRRQLGRIAHSSALGLANEPASHLAARLVDAANADRGTNRASGHQRRTRPPARGLLQKVFFSDDGSTALEVALKLAYEFTRRQRGPRSRPRFLSLMGAYHGDTVGAVSVGHIDQFHRAFSGMLFATDWVMAPYCYRCPFNRARPERADAREYRRCQWECVGQVESVLERQRKRRGEPFAAFVVEPLMQGAAGMIPQPAGWLRKVSRLVRDHGALMIADEVMTGFGRTGSAGTQEASALPDSRAKPHRPDPRPAGNLFATTATGVAPDFLCMAKGMTGGYLPMAATLTTEAVFNAFLGDYAEFKTFFHGHSYTGNQLGAAASLANLDLLESGASRVARRQLERALRDALPALWALPNVGDIRQVGLMVGIELVKNWQTRAPFDLREQAGIRVCESLARRGVLTRPIGNVIVVMPPYCLTAGQMKTLMTALGDAISETFA